jgi:hypothetical protein
MESGFKSTSGPKRHNSAIVCLHSKKQNSRHPALESEYEVTVRNELSSYIDPWLRNVFRSRLPCYKL